MPQSCALDELALLSRMGYCMYNLLSALAELLGYETSPESPKSDINLLKAVYRCHFPADKKLFADKNNSQFQSVMVKKKK